MAEELLTTMSPTTNKPILTRHGIPYAELDSVAKRATLAFQAFSRTSLTERQVIVKNALQLLRDRKDELAQELTHQMGRPIAYTAKEIITAAARGEYMLKISGEALSDTEGEAEAGFKRYIKKVPLGPVLVIFAWNVRVSTIIFLC